MKPSERLQSLDALRGFDMLFIMGFASLVVAVCGLWPNAVTDSIASQMGHASWDGFTHHDTIFPLFLFIAGVSFPFSLSKQRSLGLSTGTIYAKIVRRALTLVLLGVIYNGLFRLDFENLRIASVLGRIGLAWGIAAVLYLNFGVKARIAIAAAILVGYGLLSALVAAPDVAGAGPLTREGCLAGYVDRLLLPGKLYGKTFDPEGLLSTVPAVVTAMLGMFTGEFVRRQDLSGGRKASWMIAAAVALLVAGLAFNGVVPVNKSLWSSTFVCVVAAYSLAAFCVMGGVFSEGIDLKEERLIGAVIVGTGLPMVCVEQEVLRGYFEEKEEAGFDFAYQYPGMNKVLQAAGRVIRTTEDEGIILLLDDRFLKREYLELFPREWEHFQMVNRGNVGQCMEDFWESRK